LRNEKSPALPLAGPPAGAAACAGHADRSIWLLLPE